MKVKRTIVIGVLFGFGAVVAFAVSERDGKDGADMAGMNSSQFQQEVLSSQQGGSMPELEHINLDTIKRTIPDNIQGGGLFQPKSWYQPPPMPPVSKVVVPQPPSAPSLPFKYIGRMQEGNETVLFLSRGGQNYTAHVGDVLDDVYRLDKIADSGAEFTYLPMNTLQKLAFGTDEAGSSTPGMQPSVMTTSQLAVQPR